MNCTIEAVAVAVRTMATFYTHFIMPLCGQASPPPNPLNTQRDICKFNILFLPAANASAGHPQQLFKGFTEMNCF
jgi:hypothetical protein